jgi:hypothetical protein
VDDIVLRAMAKWPSVPSVYGWLRLDRRGDWWIRGERLRHDPIIAYIARNYAGDEAGCWFFQNGPQRVFVALDYTPYVYRVTAPERSRVRLEAHTGSAVKAVDCAWIDEEGALLLATELGIGVVDDRDLDRMVPLFIDARGRPLPEDLLEAQMERLQGGDSAPLRLNVRGNACELRPIRRAEVPARFGFVSDPEPEKEHGGGS